MGARFVTLRARQWEPCAVSGTADIPLLDALLYYFCSTHSPTQSYRWWPTIYWVLDQSYPMVRPLTTITEVFLLLRGDQVVLVRWDPTRLTTYLNRFTWRHALSSRLQGLLESMTLPVLPSIVVEPYPPSSSLLPHDRLVSLMDSVIRGQRSPPSS